MPVSYDLHHPTAPPRSPNLPVVSETDPPPAVALLYDRFRHDFHRPHVPGILTCFATHPPLLDHMIGLAQSILFSEGSLGRANKEMIATFVSSRNQCAYCADSHGAFLLAHGGTPSLLAAALACDLQAPALDPAQSALLRFVRTVTDNSHAILPHDIEALRTAGWTDQQIAETIHLTGLFAFFNRVVNAFGLESPNPTGQPR